MKISRKMTVLFAVALVSFAVHSERVDAVNKVSNAWQPRTWSSPHAWREYMPPADGGIATFEQESGYSDRGDAENYSNQNIEGLELKGLAFGKLYVRRIYGKDIKFVGEGPWVSSTSTHASNYAKTSIKMVGTGSNQLLKKGAGRLLLETPPANFSSLDIVDGTLVITNGTGTDTLCANGVPVNVKYGTLSFEPPTAAGSTVLAALNNGAGFGEVAVAKGTLTATSLTKTPGGILNVSTTDGGKFLVTGKESVDAPDGGMISLSGRTISFLDYDATAGWKVGSSTPANVKVFGDADTTGTINTGDISFETDEGYVYRPAPTAASTLNVNGSLTVPKDGITFASIPGSEGTRPTVNFTNCTSTLDGKLRFSGVAVSSAGLNASKIAKTADISICGSKPSLSTGSGSIAFNVKTLAGKPVDFTLRLAGSATATRVLSANGANWEYKLFAQNGATILEDDATVGDSELKALLRFAGPVSGRGGLWCNGGVVELTNAGNTFAGDVRVSADTVLTVTGAGVLGSGDIYLLADNSRLNFHNLTNPETIENYFLGTGGCLYLQKSTVTLKHPVQVKTTYVQNSSNLAIGGDLRTGHIYLDLGSTMSPSGSDAALITDSGVNSVLAGQLKDGDNGEKLSLVKEGANTLVMTGTNNSYSGETIVKGGTLKLGGSLFNASDVSYWLDPSDESTVTRADNGRITKIASKIGNLYFTGKATDESYPGPTYVTDEEAFNGKSFMRFAPGGSGSTFTSNPRLAGSAAAEHRTVYLVFKTTRSYNTGALMGYNTQDISLRISSDGTLTANDAPRQDYWPTANYLRFNGQKRFANVVTMSQSGKPHIVGVFVPAHYMGAGGYNHYSSFTPYFGANAERPWGGDLGEVIAFKRVLSQAECCAVENYLREKWNPDCFTAHSDDDCRLPTTACLPTGAALTIAIGASLDLNGADQTVASLAGNGTITNSSAIPARLTVTGSDDFHGQVVGNVTVTLPAGSRDIVLRNGAKLVVSGSGESAIKPANPFPPMHDLAFWLDASCEETTASRTNETGRLSRWLCRSNDLCIVKCYRNDQVDDYKPKYVSDGWNAGKPAVLLPSANSRLGPTSTETGSADKTFPLKTLFYVTRPVYNGTSYAFGLSSDRGLLLSPWDSNNSGLSINARGPSNLNACGDLLRINGVDYTLTKDASLGLNGSTSICYVMRAEGAHAQDAYFNNAQNWIIGSYSGDRGVKQYIAEMIGYTNRLSDAEVLATEKYLMDKWFNSGTEWPAQETESFDSSCGLGVAAGATLDFGAANVTLASVESQGGTISTDGTLTVNDYFVFPVDAEGKVGKLTVDGNLTIGSQAVAVFLNGERISRDTARHDALEATGEVSGGPLTTDEDVLGNWSWANFGKVWAICRRGLMILIR